MGIVKVPYIRNNKGEKETGREGAEAKGGVGGGGGGRPEGSSSWILHKLAHKIGNVHDPMHVDRKNMLCTEGYYDGIIKEIARTDPEFVSDSLAAKIENFVGKSGKDSVKIAEKKL